MSNRFNRLYINQSNVELAMKGQLKSTHWWHCQPCEPCRQSPDASKNGKHVGNKFLLTRPTVWKTDHSDRPCYVKGLPNPSGHLQNKYMGPYEVRVPPRLATPPTIPLSFWVGVLPNILHVWRLRTRCHTSLTSIAPCLVQSWSIPGFEEQIESSSIPPFLCAKVLIEPW